MSKEGRERRERKERYKQRQQQKRKQQRKSERHKNRCASCIISIIIMFVITLGALYGGGTFAWNTYAKPKFGISFNDALGLVGSTYIAKEKDIVTNPYGDDDLDGFYNELSDALFLDKEKVNLKESLADVLDSFVTSMVDSDSSEGESTDSMTEHEVSSSGESTEESSGAEEFTTGNAELDNFLKSLSFDFSSLKDYEDEYKTPKVLEITDKETAAFLNNVIGTAVSSDGIKKKVPDYIKSVDLAKVVEIPQVTVASNNAVGLEGVSLTLTVKVNLRDTIKDVAKSFHEALGFVSYLLPKALYATITIYPNDYLKEAQIKVNSFSDKKMGDLYAIVDYFLKDTEYKSINGLLQMVNQKAIEAIEKVQDVVPVNFVATGSVQVHPILALMKVLGATEITETQFYCMVRDLCLPTFEDVKEAIGLASYKDLDALDAKLVESKADLAAEITQKYGLAPGYITADNMLDKLQGVGGENSELIEKVSLARLDYTDSSYVQNHSRVIMEYVSLAGLLDGYLNKPSEGESEGSGIKYKIINSMYDEATQTLSMVLQLGVLEAIAGKMDDGSILKSFIGQIVPEYIYIKAGVSLNEADEGGAKIAINNSDNAQTIELLNTINALTSGMGASLGLNYEELTSTIGVKIKDGIKDINTQLGNDIAFTSAKAYLPSIYEIMANKILYSDEVSATNLSPAEVYLVFKGTSVVAQAYQGQNIASNLSEFTTRVNSRYAITKAEYRVTAPETDSDPTIVSQLQNVGTHYDDAIDGALLATGWKMATSTATTDEEKLAKMHEKLSPYSTEAESANIFAGAFKIDEVEGVENLQLNKVIVVDASHIRLIYTCDYKTDSSTKYASVLPKFVINVLFDITKVSSTTEDCCTVTINDMNDGEIEDFTLMCDRLGVNGFNMTSIREKTNANVKSGLKDTFEKVDISIDTSNKCIYYGSLFDITYKSKKTDIDAKMQAAFGNNGSSLDVANMIEALHTEITAYGQHDIVYDDDKFDSSTVTGPTPIHADLTARNLGTSVIKADNDGTMTAMKGQVGISTLAVYQVGMLDLGSSDDDVIAVNTLLSNSLSNLIPATGKFVFISFDITTSELSYKSTLLPEHLYLTATINNSYTSGDLPGNVNGEVKVAYNNLGDREIEVLKALAGTANEGSFDPTEVATKMKTSLDTVVLFTYGITPITFGQVMGYNAGVITESAISDLIDGEYVVDITLP